jgi:acetyl/propionyl-CoA carboxylase alpha subunit
LTGVPLNFGYEGDSVTLQAEREGEGWRVRLPDGSHRLLTVVGRSTGILALEVDGRRLRLPFTSEGGEVEISFAGQVYRLTDGPDGMRPKAQQRRSGQLLAPMVGLITRVHVEEGQIVEAYEPLLAMEAMKVVATVEAPFRGTVRLHAVERQQVEHGALVAEVIPLSLQPPDL